MKWFKLLVFLFPLLSVSQQIDKVNFKTLHASIAIDPIDKKVYGSAEYVFEVLSATDTIKIDAVNMQFSNVKINKKPVSHDQSVRALKLFEGYKKGKNTVSFDYSAIPKQTMYFVGEKDNLQIWTQGQGKGTSHWLPSFDDMNEKVVFNLSVTFDNQFTVISNGILKKKSPLALNTKWQFEMKKPMSSYLVMLAIGKFKSKIEKSESGVPLQMYYLPEDEAKFESTYKHSKAIFDFFEKEIDVKYPWEVYRQVPVKDFLYAGMENTAATVFSQDFVVDGIGFNDRNYINVNAHELAHQWFGDMITAKSGKHHWLQEGFATYYALMAERAIFGDDHFYHKMYEMASELQHAAATDTIPILNEKASSLTFYKKGAWALHVLRENVGATNFRIAVKRYLEKYRFANVETNDFLSEIKKVSSFDINTYQKTWLEKGGFEAAEAIALLKSNVFMKAYFEALDLAKVAFAEKQAKFSAILQSDVFYPIKEEVLFQSESVPFDDKEAMILLALQDQHLKVRQAVAKTLQKVPPKIYDAYHSLLDDNSYITKEIALNALWQQFPDKQFDLLEKTKGQIGFNDKNLRLQWLTLALITKEYEKANKVKFYDELVDYASPKYESSVRQNAIENLLYINPNDTNVLHLLVNPLTHHKWQFSRFAREKIRAMIKNPVHRKYFTDKLSDYPQAEAMQLQRLLDEK